MAASAKDNGYALFLRCDKRPGADMYLSPITRTVALWNKLPADCFPANFNMDFFKRKINRHLACSF